MSKHIIPFTIENYLPYDKDGNFVNNENVSPKKVEIFTQLAKVFCTNQFCKLTDEQKQMAFENLDKFVSMEMNCPTARIALERSESAKGEFKSDNYDQIIITLSNKDDKNIASCLSIYLHEKFHHYYEVVYRIARKMINESNQIARDKIAEERNRYGLPQTPVFLLFEENDPDVDPIVYKYEMEQRERILNYFKNEYNMSKNKFDLFMCAMYITHDFKKIRLANPEEQEKQPGYLEITTAASHAYYVRPDEVDAYTYEMNCSKQIRKFLKHLKSDLHSKAYKDSQTKDEYKHLYLSFRNNKSSIDNTWCILDTLDDELAGETYAISKGAKKCVKDRIYKEYLEELKEYNEKGRIY